MQSSRVVKTVCSMCWNKCGMNVYVEDGKVIKVKGMPEHPVSYGKLCPKGIHVIDWLYHPDRLTHPMKRQNGGWKRISWDEALDTVVLKLKEAKQTYGAEALSVHGGLGSYYGPGFRDLPLRFLDLYGSPNFSTVDSLCYYPREIGNRLTYGATNMPDLENANCILVIGSNVGIQMWDLAAEKAIKRGAKTIVVDPRRTPKAKKADIYVQPRPGSDCALLLGILNVIVSENLYDKEFVDKWTIGFDKFRDHLKQYSPEEVEKITWVPAASIREIAQTFAITKPACVSHGVSTLEQTTSGVQSIRAIAILCAITGNFEVKGGLVARSILPIQFLRLPDKMKDKGKPLGVDKFPLFYGVYGFIVDEAQAMLLPDAIVANKPYPIKAMIIDGGNPALTFPHSKKIHEALSKLEFLVVMDIFMTETAKLADIVLPAATFLERTQIPEEYAVFSPSRYTMLAPKVIEPLGECWPDPKLWLELGKRMGYGEYFPWKDWEEALDYILQPSGLTIEYLAKEKPEGVFYDTIKYRQYEQTGLSTPSGKFELYSETLEKLGQDPLPTHREPLESPISTPELAKEYPLILTTGARVPQYVHSQFHNIAQLKKASPEPIAEIHATTASQYGIADGDMIDVETKRGSIQVKTKATQDIIPGVVSICHGWSEANVNLLTDSTPADPISGFPALKALLCKISNAN